MTRQAHGSYHLRYHLILVTKYRRPVITDKMWEAMEKEAARLMAMWDWKLVEAKHEADHVHFLIETSPDCNLADTIGNLKASLTRNMRAMGFEDHIRSFIHNGRIWSDSYYIATVGDVSLEKVRAYISAQGVKRKYTKRDPKYWEARKKY